MPGPAGLSSALYQACTSVPLEECATPIAVTEKQLSVEYKFGKVQATIMLLYCIHITLPKYTMPMWQQVFEVDCVFQFNGPSQ